MKKTISRMVFSATLALTGVSAMAADYGNVSMACIPIGTPAGTSVMPMRVSLSNAGTTPAQANIHVDGGFEGVVYPVTVYPGKNSTSLTIYPLVDEDPSTVDRTGNAQFGVHVSMTAVAQDGSKSASDFRMGVNQHGGLSAVAVGNRTPATQELTELFKSGGSQQQPLFKLGNYPAKLAPERLAGYRGMQFVLLTNGYDQMSVAACDTLRSYVLSGGTLFISGEVAPSSPWASLVKPHGISLVGLGEIVSLEDSFADHLAVSGHGTPQNESGDSYHVGSQGPATSSRVGRGLQATGYYPDQICLDEFISAVSGSAKLIVPLGNLQPREVYNTSAGSQNPVSASDNPFAAAVPPFGRILFMLCAYFVTVVPINLFILKRARKPELAWISAPALSIVFAVIVFSGRGDFAKAGISSATRGALVLQTGVPTGIFEGTSQLFFPTQASSDLKLQNAESVRPSFEDERGGLPSTVSFATVDDGTFAHVPAYSTTSLSFSSIDETQKVAAADWVTFNVGKPDRDGLIEVDVRNNSPYEIKGACLNAGDLPSPGSDLKPGETLKVKTMRERTYRSDSQTPGQPDGVQQLMSQVGQRHRLLLTGQPIGIQLGANVGHTITARQDIELYAFGPRL